MIPPRDAIEKNVPYNCMHPFVREVQTKKLPYVGNGCVPFPSRGALLLSVEVTEENKHQVKQVFHDFGADCVILR